MTTESKEQEFTISDGMSYAEAVKSLLLVRLQNRLMEEGQYTYLSIGAYCNGREQGLSFSFGGKKIRNKKGETSYAQDKTFLVSENRNSDAIVVYYQENFGRELTDEGYATAKYFQYNEFDKAVKYILKTAGVV
jgi:hypothetical protein